MCKVINYIVEGGLRGLPIFLSPHKFIKMIRQHLLVCPTHCLQASFGIFPINSLPEWCRLGPQQYVGNVAAHLN